MATQNSLSYPPRTATINRDTKETQVQIKLCIDGGQLEDIPTVEWSERTNKHAFQESPSQYIDIDTGIGFLDHMLHALSKHAGWSLWIRCQGDLHIDDHHSTEDIFITLGDAVHKALTGTKTSSLGLYRFGHSFAPLDEALSRAVVDLSNRPFAVVNLEMQREKVGELSTEMLTHGLLSFAQAAGLTMHVDVLRGENDHHRADSAFQALAGALRMACARRSGVGEGEMQSTKGVLY
jgi:imidazoleglycerol-phosphate dehydratase